MKKHAIGVDFGGTYTKLALVDRMGRLGCRAVLPTKDFDTKEAFLDAVIHEIGSILKKARLNYGDLLGIGFGAPGLVDFERGFVHYLTNVAGWRNVSLKEALKRRLKVNVLIDNDVNLMALGEYRFGAGRGARSLVCLTLGTGVGGGIIIEGKLLRGSAYAAGEIGHMPLKEKGLPCNCGGFGCLERYVGNSFIVEEFRKKIRAGGRTLVEELVKGDLSLITPELISRAAKEGDELSADFWREIGERIGLVLSGVINLLNPDKIVIGGGMAKAGEVLFGSIRRTVDERALPISKKAVKIVRAKLGADAGVVGAAALFL